MARSKAIRVEKPLAARRQPRSDLCTMSTFRRPPSLKMKKRKKPVWVPEDAGISKEISWLQDDIAANPCPESTQPRQEPAMSRYHGAPPKSQSRPEPKEKRCHSRRSWKKAKGSNPLTEPEEVAAHLTKPEAPGPLTKPEVPAPPRRSEVTPSRTQPDVIDLTGED